MESRAGQELCGKLKMFIDVPSLENENGSVLSLADLRADVDNQWMAVRLEENQKTALMLAVEKKHISKVKVFCDRLKELRSNGALYIVSNYLKAVDSIGNTVLFHAINLCGTAIQTEKKPSVEVWILGLLLALVPKGWDGLTSKNSAGMTLYEACFLQKPSFTKYKVLRWILEKQPDMSNDSKERECFFAQLIEDLASYEEAMGVKVNRELVTKITELALDNNANTNYTHYRDGTSLLHRCVTYNQPIVLKKLLDHYSAAPTVQLSSMLSYVDNYGLTPLLEACWSNFPKLTDCSRLECIKMLLDAGADIDERTTIVKMTPLSLCLHGVSCTHNQQNIACYLIEQGADAMLTDQEGDSCVYKALYSNASQVIEMMLQKQVMKVNEKLDKTMRLPIVHHCIIYIHDHRLQEPYRASTDVIRNFHKYGSPTADAVFYLCFSDDRVYGKPIFKILVELGSDLNSTANRRLPLLHMNVVQDDFHYMRFLVRHGAEFGLKYAPTVCKNEAPHRLMLHDSLDDFLTFHNQSSELTTYYCHVCVTQLRSTDRVFCCAKSSECRCRICDKCRLFYIKTAEEKTTHGESGVSLSEMTKRKGNPIVINWTHFAANTYTGNHLIGLKKSRYLDEFLAAGISTAKLFSKLTSRHLSQMGIRAESILSEQR